jgi:segregation and condensation protein A
VPEIHLPVFDGPLDLLLHLIEREDLDITAVSLVAVTDQYLKAIRDGEAYRPAALAEFVAIGSRLILLKSRALLPRPPALPGSEDEEDDVGQELVELLLEYRRFSEVAEMLGSRQESGLRSLPRNLPVIELPEGPGLQDVTVETLRLIMLNALRRTPVRRTQGTIQRDTTMTLSQRVRDLRSRLITARRLSFRALISECRTRVEVIVTFMAVLELLKAGECDAQQADNWGDIEVLPPAIPAAS